MRPRGAVASAMLAAAQQRPAPVRQLAAAAQVGHAAAKYTASRMVSRGELVVVNCGQRPRVLAPAPAVAPCGETLAQALQQLRRAFWQTPQDDDGECES